MKPYAQALMDIICRATCSKGHYGVNHDLLHDAFIAWHNVNPAPIDNPKPAEPTGLGAVVVDRDGSALVRVDGDSSHPWRATGGHRFSWDDVDHLTTLSEGAEPMADWEIDLLRGAR